MRWRLRPRGCSSFARQARPGAAQASLLPFGQNVPGAVAIGAVQYDPTAPNPDPLNLLPELFQRLRKNLLLFLQLLAALLAMVALTAPRVKGTAGQGERLLRR